MSIALQSQAHGLPPGSGMWRSGVLVGGRYRLLGKLGAGAMGEVWKAEQVTLGRTVALKLIDVAGRSDADELLSRFHQEARAAAQLQSQNVVQILDHGVAGTLAFMAMELLEGESLEQRLARRKTLLPAEVAHVVREMARGIERAHAAGIIHRDLKPPNVFLQRHEGVEIVKVLDFGIAKVLGDPREAHLQTQQGIIVGTPAYMSPEQVLGRPLDARSDLWQMAVITYECLCGQRPFDGEALGQLFMGICTAPIRMPSTLARVPPGFDAWIVKALDRAPEGRFQTATELAESLCAILAPTGVGEAAIATLSSGAGQRSGHALPLHVEAQPTGRSVAWSTGQPEAPLPRRARVPLWLWIAVPVVGVAVAAGLFVALRQQSDTSSSASPAAPASTGAATSVAASAPATASAAAPVASAVPAASASASTSPPAKAAPARPKAQTPGAGAPDFGF